MTDAFGDIRSLLQRAPTRGRWGVLGLVLEGAGEDAFHEVLLPYCDGALRAWPDELRVLRAGGARAMLAGETPRLAKLCAGVEVATDARGPEWRRMAQAELPHLTRLRVDGVKYGGAPGFAVFLEMGHLDRLESLEFRDLKFADVSFDALLERCARMPRLKRLCLERCRIDEEKLLRLLDSPVCAKLEGLSLRDNRLRPKDIQKLAAHPNTDGLEVLLLGALPRDPMFADRHAFYNTTDDDARRMLGEPSRMPKLRGLELAYHKIDDRQLGAFLNDDLFPSLEALDIRVNRFKGRGAALLAGSRLWSKLERVDLGGNSLGARGTDALLRAGRERDLVDLRLSRTKPGKAGVVAASEAPSMRTVTRFEFTDNRLREEHMLPLLASMHMPQLERCDVSRNTWTSAIGELLAKAPMLRPVRALGAAGMSLPALRRFVEHLELPNLEEVTVQADAGTLERLREEFPRLRALDVRLSSSYHWHFVSEVVPILEGAR
ncbi:MAG: hypothetical protein AAGI01_07510 [Myxococcota bacterium]